MSKVKENDIPSRSLGDFTFDSPEDDEKNDTNEDRSHSELEKRLLSDQLNSIKTTALDSSFQESEINELNNIEKQSNETPPVEADKFTSILKNFEKSFSEQYQEIEKIQDKIRMHSPINDRKIPSKLEKEKSKVVNNNDYPIGKSLSNSAFVKEIDLSGGTSHLLNDIDVEDDEEEFSDKEIIEFVMKDNPVDEKEDVKKEKVDVKKEKEDVLEEKEDIVVEKKEIVVEKEDVVDENEDVVDENEDVVDENEDVKEEEEEEENETVLVDTPTKVMEDFKVFEVEGEKENDVEEKGEIETNENDVVEKKKSGKLTGIEKARMAMKKLNESIKENNEKESVEEENNLPQKEEKDNLEDENEEEDDEKEVGEIIEEDNTEINKEIDEENEENEEEERKEHRLSQLKGLVDGLTAMKRLKSVVNKKKQQKQTAFEEEKEEEEEEQKQIDEKSNEEYNKLSDLNNQMIELGYTPFLIEEKKEIDASVLQDTFFSLLQQIKSNENTISSLQKKEMSNSNDNEVQKLQNQLGEAKKTNSNLFFKIEKLQKSFSKAQESKKEISEGLKKRLNKLHNDRETLKKEWRKKQVLFDNRGKKIKELENEITRLKKEDIENLKKAERIFVKNTRQAPKREDKMKIQIIKSYEKLRKTLEDEITTLKNRLKRGNNIVNASNDGDNNNDNDNYRFKYNNLDMEYKKMQRKIAKFKRESEQKLLMKEKSYELLNKENKNLRRDLQNSPTEIEWKSLQSKYRELLKKEKEKETKSSYNTILPSQKISLSMKKEVGELSEKDLHTLIIDIMKVMQIKSVSKLMSTIRRSAVVISTVPKLRKFVSEVCHTLQLGEIALQSGKKKVYPSAVVGLIESMISSLLELKSHEEMELEIIQTLLKREDTRLPFEIDEFTHKVHRKYLVDSIKVLVLRSNKYLEVYSKSKQQQIEQPSKVNSSDYYTRLIHFFMKLFNCNLKGVVPKMNVLHQQMKECNSLLRSLRNILNLSENASVSQIYQQCKRLTNQ